MEIAQGGVRGHRGLHSQRGGQPRLQDPLCGRTRCRRSVATEVNAVTFRPRQPDLHETRYRSRTPSKRLPTIGRRCRASSFALVRRRSARTTASLRNQRCGVACASCQRRTFGERHRLFGEGERLDGPVYRSVPIVSCRLIIVGTGRREAYRGCARCSPPDSRGVRRRARARGLAGAGQPVVVAVPGA
jgi:hypothetical protein